MSLCCYFPRVGGFLKSILQACTMSKMCYLSYVFFLAVKAPGMICENPFILENSDVVIYMCWEVDSRLKFVEAGFDYLDGFWGYKRLEYNL